MSAVVHVVDGLVEATGDATLAEVERVARAGGLTLDVALDDAGRETTVARWIADGAKGARSALEDPADHLVAGFEGTLRDGRALVVRPEPRRAVGPDLVALVMGVDERFVRVTKAWLRAHRVDAPRPTMAPPRHDLEADLGDAEARLLDAIARELG